ncbi:MAG: class I SAM-dependent methyltransferase [Chloroflexota bacterium]
MSTNSTAYNPEAIAAYFDEFASKEWDRLTITPVDEVSLYLHSHYLQTYVKSGQRVLEIGAGAGRFTQILARIGARILTADISKVQLDLNRQFAHNLGFASQVEGWQRLDICQMDDLAANSFDSVVAYGGPFSYVLDRRKEALAECWRVLKPGGLLFSSVMMLWGSAHRGLPGVLAVPAANNKMITTTGDLTPETMNGRLQAMHLFRAQEYRTFLENAGLEIVNLSASGCLCLGWQNQLAEMRKDTGLWAELLRLELEASAEPGCLDMGTHLIAVCRKP